MKKKAAIIVAIVTICVMAVLTGCSKQNTCTVRFAGAENIELESYGDEFKRIEADGDKVVMELSKEGTYEVKLKIDDKDHTMEVTCEKGGYSVGSDAEYDMIVSVE